MTSCPKDTDRRVRIASGSATIRSVCSSVAAVRSATPADEPRVKAIVNAAYSPYIDRMGGDAPAPMSDDYAELIARHVVSVATTGEQLVGVIVMWPHIGHLHVDNIAVAPDVAGTGVGTMLLRHADDTARSLGLGEVRLYTNAAMTENLAYYRRQGFTETHRQVDRGYHRVYFTRSVSDP